MTHQIFMYKLLIFLALFAGHSHAANPLLAELANEDQQSRMGQTFERTDRDRQKIVLEMIAKGALKDAKDRFNAALVLQHTAMGFCGDQLVSLSPDNYLIAHHLFMQSMAEGHPNAAYLAAAAIDRFLSLTEGKQRYGTNRFINQETGAEELSPIDRSVSDEERAKYGVPPLAELLKKYPESKPRN